VLLWRITRKPFLSQALEGLGAKRYGGRWNSKGFAMVYSAESLELAVLEALVHVDIDLLPKDVYQIAFDLDDQFIAPVPPT
jgi:RES domain-containing protein